MAKIKYILSRQHFEKIIHAFITTRLGYCNALYFGVSQASLSRLQLVQNAAARLLTLGATALILKLFYLFLNVLMALLHLYFPLWSLRSADQLLLVAPKTRLKLRGGSGFCGCGPKIVEQVASTC